MASCDVQIAPSNSTTLISIESFMSDSTYRDIIENSANYNTRLCVERKLRMPFLDAQTGVAQNHSNLFMNSRQRMPGMEVGQEYTYPAKRWRKKRRQYLMNFLQPKRKENGDIENTDNHIICASETPITLNEDSKDSLGGSSSKDESIPKETWYYDEIEMQEIEGYDEPDPDSDYDYEDTYAKKRKRRSTKSARSSTADSPMRRGVKGFGRGRRRGMNYTPDFSVDSDKPYYCDLCGARYKTRPGLTYHYTHSHKEKPQDDENSLEGAPVSPNSQKDKLQQQPSMPVSKDMLSSPMPGPGVTMPMNPNAMHPSSAHPDANQSGPGGWGKFQDSYLTFLGGSPGSANASGQPSKKTSRPPSGSASQILSQIPAVPQLDNASAIAGPSAMNMGGMNATLEDESSSESDKKDDFSKDASPSVSKRSDKTKANPSPYCDFCLGNEESNKKSGQPEELVSCSDCGRSGHPSCLQFTANMIISVRKYRWQCIECKCCSICGTSDNDDQLLFCDDCDRGYHMYCLSPPLSAPPEGSWSCKLCIKEFHSK